MFKFFEEIIADLKYAIHFYDHLDYEVLSFGQETFRIVLLFMWFGAIFAFCAMYYNNHYLGGFVQRLILSGATSKENAKTLSELGCADKLLLKYSLREGSVLRKCVLAQGQALPTTSEFYKGIGTAAKEEENDSNTDNDAEFDKSTSYAKKGKENVSTLAFYIPEYLVKKAQTRYRKKGNGILPLILSIVVLGIVVFFAMVYGPLLLQFIDNALVTMKGSGANSYRR